MSARGDRGLHWDLAAQTRVRLDSHELIQEIAFVRDGRRKFSLPLHCDIFMAGAAYSVASTASRHIEIAETKDFHYGMTRSRRHFGKDTIAISCKNDAHI